MSPTSCSVSSISAFSRPANEAQVPEMRQSPVFGFSWNGRPSPKTACETSSVEGIQELTMCVGVDAQVGRIFIRKSPADIVMDVDIIDPGTTRRNSEPAA